jgi:ABC-type sugar transport system ATPase subunit
MRADIAALQARLGVTTAYVTHDQAEAMTLGDRLAVMDEGRLQQCGPPRELYAHPVNTFVAGFIGSPAMNLVTVPLEGQDAVRFCGQRLVLPREAAATSNGDGEIVLGLRPEALELASDGVGAEVEVVEEFGADAYVFCVSQIDGQSTKLVARTEASRAPARSERVMLRPREHEAHFFDARTGVRLGGV